MELKVHTGFHGTPCVRQEQEVGGCTRCHHDHRGDRITMSVKLCRSQACACK
jgi:hypothetical protein